MKTSLALVLLSAFSAQAFVPVSQPSVTTALSAKAKPAKSAAEDIELTRKVIAQFLGDEMPSEEAPAPPKKAKEESED